MEENEYTNGGGGLSFLGQNAPRSEKPHALFGMQSTVETPDITTTDSYNKRVTRARAENADMASVGYNEDKFAELMASGRGLSQISDDELDFIRDRYSKSDISKRKAYTNSAADKFLSSAGLPSSKELNTYRQKYIDYMGNGGIEQHPELSDKDGNLTDASKWIQKQWEKDNAEGLGGETVTSGGKDIKYEDTYLDDQLKSIGLPPSARLNEYFLKYKDDKAIDDLVGEFYSDVYKNGQGANAEDAFRETLGKPKYSKLAEYWAEPAKIPNGDQYTDTAKYDKDYKTALETNAKREEMDHRVSYDDYSNYAARRSAEERRTAQEKKYKEINEKAYQWYTKPATTPQEKKERENDMRNYLNVYGGGDNYTPYIDEETKEVVDPVRIATESNSTFRLLDLGMSPKMAGEIYDGSGTLDVFGLAAAVDWNNSRNASPAEKAEVAMILSGASTDSTTYDMDKEVITETYRVTDSKSYDKRKSFDANDYRNQITGGTSAVEKVTFAGAVYALVNGQKHGMPDYSDQTDYGIFQTFTKTDSSGKSIAEFMTDDEKGTFNYLFHYDKKRAMKYAEDLSDMLARRRQVYTSGTYDEKARSGVIPETDAAQYGADNYINRTRRKLETIPESRSDYWQREAWEAYGGYSDYALQLVIDDAKSGDASEIFAQAEAAEARGEYFNLDDAVAEKDKNAAYAQYILDLRKKAQEVGAVEASMLKYKASEGEEATKSIKAEDCVGSKYGLIVNGLEKYASMKAFSTFADQLRDNETIVMHDVLVNMTKEEKNQFNWLLKNKGAKEADAYIDLIYSTLDERGKERSAAVYTDFAKEHPGAASAASLVAFPVSGLASLSGSFINAVTGTKTTKQQATMWDPSGIMTEAVSDVIASKVGKGFWGDAAVFGYQTTMSMAQSGIAAAISAAVPGLGGFLLASNAFGSTLREGLDRGLDPDRATATAFLAGVAEMFFEEVSLEKFITGIKGAKDWRTVLANIAKQSFTEGSEEFFTEVANITSDYLINQDMSELQQKYDDYIDRGYTPEEANSLIAKDIGTQLGMATLGGAVSGGIMGGLGNIGAFGFNAALGRLEEKAGIVRNEGTNFKEVKAALAPQNFGVKNPATTEQVRAIGASEKFLTRTFGKNIADQVWGQAAVNNISSERIDTFKNAITQDTNTNSYLWGITHDGQNNISLSDDELTSLAACMAALTDEGEANPEAAYIALMAASQSETALKANNDIKNIKSVEELNGFREAIQDARDGIEGQMETLRDLQSQVAEESNDAMARENESLQRAIAAFEDGDIKGVITALESKSAKSTETTSKNRKANEVWKAIDKARRQIAKNYKEISRQQGYVDKHFSSLYNYLAEVAPQSMYGANAAAFVAQNLKNETERLRSEISDVLTNENLSEKARDARLKNLVRMLQNAASSAQVAGSDEVMANPQAFTNAINAAKNGNAAAHQALVRNKAGVKFNNNASSSASNASDTQSSKDSNKAENTASEDVKQETTQGTQEDKPVTQTTPTKEKYEYKVDDRTQKAWVKLLKKRFGIDLIWVDSDTVLPDGTKLGNHNGCYIDTESESKKIFMNRTITSGIKASTNEVIAREYITHEMTHYIENTSNYVDLKRSALSYYRKLKGDDWVKNALKGIAQKRIEEGLAPSARSVSGEFVARFVQDVLFRENNKQSKALVWLTRQNKGVVGDMLTYIQYLIARAELRKSPDNELKIMLLDAEMHFLTALKERQVLDSKTSAAEAKPVQTEDSKPKQEEATQEQPAQEETVAEQPVEEAQPVQEETPAEKPVQEEPVSERQVAEEPVTEEATEEVAEEPAVEEPVAEEKPAEEKTAPEEQPVEETQPVQEEPVSEQQTAEEPVAEEVTEEVVEEPVSEEPVVEETVTEEQPVQQEPVAEEQPVQEKATPAEQPVEETTEPTQEKAPAEQPVQETASQQEETTPVQEESQTENRVVIRNANDYANASLDEAQQFYKTNVPSERIRRMYTQLHYMDDASTGELDSDRFGDYDEALPNADITYAYKNGAKNLQRLISSRGATDSTIALATTPSYIGYLDSRSGAYLFGKLTPQRLGHFSRRVGLGHGMTQVNLVTERSAYENDSFIDNIINYGYFPEEEIQYGNSRATIPESSIFGRERNTLGSDVVFSDEQKRLIKSACNRLVNREKVVIALPSADNFEANSLQVLREVFSAIPQKMRTKISFATAYTASEINGNSLNERSRDFQEPSLVITTKPEADNVRDIFGGYKVINLTGDVQRSTASQATQTAQQSESTVEKAQPKQKRSTSKSEFKPKQALTEVNRMLKTIAASHPSLGGGAIQLNDDQLEGGGYLVTDAYQAYVFKEAFDGLPVANLADTDATQGYKQRMGDAIGLARREYENGNATPLGINVTKETLEDYAKSLGWATPRSSRYGALPIELQNGMGVNTQYLYQALSIFPDAQFYLANTGISGNLPVIYVTSQYGDGLISPMRLDKKGYKDVGTMIREQYGKSNDSVSDIKKIAKREETSVQKKEKNFAAKATELVTNTPITARATKGRVTYAFHGMNTEGQANARSLKNIKESLTPSQLAKVTFWEKIAEAMDVDLVIHDSFSDIDGKIRIGGWFARSSDLKVHVTLDATAMSTVAHELTHFMEYYAPGEYSELRQALKNEIGKKAFDDLVKNRAKAYRLNMDVSSEHKIADGEAVANLCESMLNDPERIKRFATTAPNAAQTLLDRLKKWISAIKSAIKSLSEFDLKKSDSPGDLIESQETVNKWISGLQVAINKYNETVKQNAYEINQMAGVSENKQREFVSEINNAQTEQEEDNIINQFAVDITKADTPGYISDLKTLIDLGTMQQSEVTELENTMNEAISMVSLHRDILDFGGVYNTQEEVAAAKANRAYKPYKENADPHYKLALDFSTLCRKRVLLQSIQERLQAKLSRALTQEETVAIRLELQKLQKEGYQIEVACALCYVEAARLKSPKVINDFLTNTETEMRKFFAKKNKDAKAFVAEKQREWKVANGYNENATKKPGKKSYDADGNIIPGMVMSPSDTKRFNEYSSQVRSEYQGTDGEKDIIKEAVRMTKEEPEQFLSAANLAKMKKEKPEIFQAFTDKVRAATRSKAQETDTFYARGDIDMVSDSVIEYANAESGFRHQSWSDFVPMHLLDTIASIIEMSTRKYTDRNGVEHTGAKMHAYTKVPDMVRFLGKTGMMLNMSLIPKGATGLKENGDLDFDSVEGMDYDTMLALRDMFPETAGNIAIGISDEQIRKMLDSNEIDYVIPYHASGLNQTMRGYLDIQSWSEFTTSQNEKSKVKRNQKKPPALAEWFKEDEARNATDGYEYMRRASKEYIRLCNERKYVPKFAQYLTENADGTYSLNDEYKNYWKLLIDRKMVNHKTGKVIIQSAVKPIFDRATALGILQEKIDRDTNPDILGDAQAREEVVKRFSDWRADRNNADAAAIKEAKSVRNRAKTAAPIASIVKSADMIAQEVLNNEDVDDRRYSDDLSLDEYAEAGSAISPSEDAAYMSLAERYKGGDTSVEAELQNAVDKAAKDAGYTIKAYHGTTENFTEFSRAKQGINHDGYLEFGAGFYFTPNAEEARGWVDRGRSGRSSDSKNVMAVYLKPSRILDADSTVNGGDRYLKSMGLSDWEASFISSRGYRFINYLIEEKNFTNTEAQETLMSLGYDAIDATYGNGKSGQYVVFAPEQIKSADPVTYDDNGNIIPLNKRFNEYNRDIRYSDDMSLDEYAEAGSELETSVSIRDGVNKATGEPVNFIDLILDGQKKGETRNSKGLPVNKWVGIHKNGQVLGRVIFGEPIPITKNSPEYKDAYIDGTDFDIEDGQEKYYYPILDVEDFRDNPIPTAKGHNSPRYAKYNPSSSNTYYSDNMTLEDYAEQYGQKQQNPYGAANNIVTPERTSDTNRVSDSVQTLKQVRSLSQNTRDLIDSGVLEEGLGTYDPITLNNMRKQGMDYIAEHGGLSQAMRDLTSEMPNVRARDLTRIIAAANQVFYEIGSEGITSQEYADFVSEYVMMRSAWGRMGRAMQLVNDSPLGRRTYWEKVIKKINSQNKESVESGVNRLFYRKGYQKIEVPEIYFQELQEAQTQEEIDAAEYEITNWIGGNSPLTVGEALRNWRYLAMLANPVTHFRNMLGNMTMQAGRVAKDAIAAGIENIAVRRGAMTQNERTHAIRPNLSQEGKARVEELYQQHKQAIQSGGRDGFSNTLREAKRKSPFLLVDLLMQFNSQKLEDEDELFLHMTFKSAAAQIIAARGYDATKLTQDQINEVVAYATQQAQEATYRDASKVADTLNQIAKSGWLAQLIVEGAVPFKKTPINIAKRGVLEYSPIGLARGIIDLGRNAMSSRRGNGYVISASKVADELGRGLTGSALALLGFFLSKAGILKISAGDDDRDSSFERDIGHQNYSIEIGNVSFKIDSLAPLTMPLFVGAALREEFGDGISLADFADTVAAIANPLMDMSFMSAINDALDTYDDNGMQGVLTNLAWSYASQYVPTFGGKLNNAFTPTRRTAKSAGDARNANADYRLRSMAMKVPGLSQAWLEPYVKTTGEYDVKDSGTEWVLSFMDNFLLPVNVQVIDTNPINEELARVVRVTGSTEFIPKNPTKQLTINGETRKLSAKEYTEYSKDHNESVYGALADTILSNEYAVASEEDRAAMLEKAYSSAHRAAMKKWQGIYGSQE